LSVANEKSNLPIDYLLYLLRERAGDSQHRYQAEVLASVVFQTKIALTLEQLQRAHAQQVASGVLLTDAGYGDGASFLDVISSLGLTRAVGIQGSTTVWARHHDPLGPRGSWDRGRPGVRLRRDRKHQPVDVKALAHDSPGRTWRRVEWRESSAEALIVVPPRPLTVD
jgi:SRSO17 transposase